jgi:hypothetical protein
VAGVFEDETHFILKCKVNQNMRESLFNNIELDNEIFLNCSEKLVYLLNPASVRHVKSYWLLFETVIRTGDRSIIVTYLTHYVCSFSYTQLFVCICHRHVYICLMTIKLFDFFSFP